MTCNAFFHIGITSLRMKCAGIGGLTTEVTVSRMGHYIILRRTLSTLSKPPRRVFTHAGWVASFYSNERHYHLLQQQLPRKVGAGGAPLHRLTAVPLALSGEA